MSQVRQSSEAANHFVPPQSLPDETPPAHLPNVESAAGPDASQLEQLRDNVAAGFMYSHSRANANTSKVLEVASFSYALIELLMERGIISVEELDARKKQIGQRLVEKFTEKGMGVALTNDEQDKYNYEGGVKIDCENRLHLCRGACCRLSFALTVQDLEEGRVKWDLGRPYMIRTTPTVTVITSSARRNVAASTRTAPWSAALTIAARTNASGPTLRTRL